MIDLIPIQEIYNRDGEELQTVNARDLHDALGVKKDFSDWVKQQIDRGMFEEDQDFVALFPQKGEQRGRGGHNKKDYFFTLEAGKHIAMMSGTARGKRVRSYFIEVEKRARELENDPATRFAKALLDAQKMLSMKDEKIHELERDLGIATDYKSVKAIDWLKEFFDFKLAGTWVVIGQQLAAISKGLGIPPRPIEDTRYGRVNAYHIDVIDEFFDRLEEDWTYCLKYRIKSRR